ncbi:glycosyltransferase [Neolewinella lacunae]|uniref:glycosyltransferase n=1 Tax=Neolewinella lacunae TaxID=1517758 RepID=UPI001CA38B39|nr:glycosyltransferase [Neolewinella lacunae]
MGYLCGVIILLLAVLVLCGLGVLHTYLFYPWQMRIWARTQVLPPGPPKGGERMRSDEGMGWPPVYVLMAAHNEEAVLGEKLATLVAQDYPGPLYFRIGSDCSSDATNGILEAQAAADGRFAATYFTVRQGKPAIINQLAAAVIEADAVFVLTDASVMLRPETVRQLVLPLLSDARLGVVDATMVQTGGRAEGIGLAEEKYISGEVWLKRAEGLRWGAMMGPFGGCWAIRAAAFHPVPANFLVDDFYLCLAAYEAGWRGRSSPDAIVYEAVGQSIAAEFRRKVRISSGNWQNLVRFRTTWWPPGRSGVAYAFFSHKILRWWTPFFLLGGALAWAGLAFLSGNYWALALFVLVISATLGLALTDLLLSRLGIHLAGARAMRYFLAMNAALLVGFLRFINGIQSNVWQPSQRN